MNDWTHDFPKDEPENQVNTDSKIATKDPVDLSVLEEIVGDDKKVVKELVDLFLDNSSDRIQTLNEAVNQKDAKSIEKEAHAFKGASGGIGASELYGLCLKLESAGEDRNFQEAKHIISTLENEFDRVAIRCEFSQYDSAVDCAKDYSFVFPDTCPFCGEGIIEDDGNTCPDCEQNVTEAASMDYLQENTTVIEFEGGIIIQQF